jgi:hypothetical protein
MNDAKYVSRMLAVLLCVVLVMTMGAGTAFADSGLLIAPRPASGLTIEVPNFEGGINVVQADGSGLVGSNFFFVPATVKLGGEVVTDYEIIQDGDPYFAVDMWEDGRFYLKPLKSASRASFNAWGACFSISTTSTSAAFRRSSHAASSLSPNAAPGSRPIQSATMSS